MQIILNGEAKKTSAENLAGLFKELSLKREFCAVELDGKVIKSNEPDDIPLREGIRIEILRFVGGG